MKFLAEFRNCSSDVKSIEVELEIDEARSVETAEYRGKEEAAVLAYAYAQRRAYALAPAGYSLYRAERIE